MPQTTTAFPTSSHAPDGAEARSLCQIPMHEMAVTAFSHGLANLIGQFDQAMEDAERRGGSPRALLDARLAPDMRPLALEIGLACEQARGCVARLLGAALPRPLRTNTPERARDAIETTLAELWECDRSLIDAAARRPVTSTLPDGAVFDLSGRQYVRDWAVPQYYLHIVTAFAILRARGSPVVEADYALHMMRYLRPSPSGPSNG